MESILNVKRRRGKRTRSIVYDKPEKSMLTVWQLVLAIFVVVFAIALIIRYLVLT